MLSEIAVTVMGLGKKIRFFCQPGNQNRTKNNKWQKNYLSRGKTHRKSAMEIPSNIYIWGG
jgi:hypothetical protein